MRKLRCCLVASRPPATPPAGTVLNTVPMNGSIRASVGGTWLMETEIGGRLPRRSLFIDPALLRSLHPPEPRAVGCTLPRRIRAQSRKSGKIDSYNNSFMLVSDLFAHGKLNIGTEHVIPHDQVFLGTSSRVAIRRLNCL